MPVRFPLPTLALAWMLALAPVALVRAEGDRAAFLDGVTASLVASEYTGAELAGAASIQAGRNYTFNCIEFRTAVLSGDPTLEGSVAGFAFGVSDALAQLHCFVRDRRCACLRDWPVGHPGDFGRLVGTEIATCQRDRAAAGAIQQAIGRFCN